jgi:hypothetical protein
VQCSCYTGRLLFLPHKRACCKKKHTEQTTQLRASIRIASLMRGFDTNCAILPLFDAGRENSLVHFKKRNIRACKLGMQSFWCKIRCVSVLWMCQREWNATVFDNTPPVRRCQPIAPPLLYELLMISLYYPAPRVPEKR